MRSAAESASITRAPRTKKVRIRVQHRAERLAARVTHVPRDGASHAGLAASPGVARRPRSRSDACVPLG